MGAYARCNRPSSKWLRECRCAFWRVIVSYQWVAGHHEHLRGAVSDPIGNAGCPVHNSDRALLPGLLGCFHQLHRHPDFSKALHPGTGWRALLPEPKVVVVARRYWERKSNWRNVRWEKWDACSLDSFWVSMKLRRVLSQTMRSFPPRSLSVLLRLPPTSCI